MPNTLRLASSPIDSFVDYFLDTKPYHTKILEVVETYTFLEEMLVSMEETALKDILIENDELCKQTGFGLDYDDKCGYDAIDCCDLFDCFGGYGFIFDNSDMLLNLPVLNFEPESDLSDQFTFTGGALEDAWLEVEGNFLADTRLPIKRIPSSTQIVLDGDMTEFFEGATDGTKHNIFLLVDIQHFEIDRIEDDVVYINGNHEDFFSIRKEFFVLGEPGFNNKIFYYTNTFFNPATNETELHLLTPLSSVPDRPSSVQPPLRLQIRTDSVNKGIYQSFDVTFNGSETIINVFSGEPLTETPDGDYSLGSIQLRTALNSPRLLTVLNEETNEEEELKILYAEYDAVANITKVFVAGSLDFIEGVSASDIRLQTYGYFFEPGFDGDEECTPPKTHNIHTRLYERFIIEVEDDFSEPPIGAV